MFREFISVAYLRSGQLWELELRRGPLIRNRGFLFGDSPQFKVV